MSKKAKGLVLGGSLPLSEDVRARLKHQTLLQDYQDLQKEAVGMRMKLDAVKQRRRALLAEVRFLRRRHRYLIKIKSMERPVQSPTRVKNQLEMKGRKSHKREVTQFKVPPFPDLKPEGRVYAGKGTSLKNTTSALDLNHKLAENHASQRNSAPVSDLNYGKRLCNGNDTAIRNSEAAVYFSKNEKFQDRKGLGAKLLSLPSFDLNPDNGGGKKAKLPSFDLNPNSGAGKKAKLPSFDLNLDNGIGRKEAVFPSHIPAFDLNEVSMEEQHPQPGDEPWNFEESKRSLTRSGTDEHSSDVKISICRNAGDGAIRMGKQKISWQDPVALRV